MSYFWKGVFPQKNNAFFDKLKQKSLLLLTSKKAYIYTMIAVYSGLLFYAYYLYPEKFFKFMSAESKRFAQIQIPKSMRQFLFRRYINKYGVDTTEFDKPLSEFKTFSEFFTRNIHPRPIDAAPTAVLCPSHGKILKIEQIKTDTCSIIKGAKYSLGELITGEELQFSQQNITNLKKNPANKLFQVIFYLAPGDYHRFHAPLSFTVIKKNPIEGTCYSVSQKSILKRKKVYEKNGRICLHSKWSAGYLGLIFVGALNVSQIHLQEKETFQKGEEIGYFNLGSTIVMIFQAKQIKDWLFKEGDKVKYADKLCDIVE